MKKILTILLVLVLALTGMVSCDMLPDFGLSNEDLGLPSVNGEKPQGLCDSAWGSMEYFVKELANGGGNFFDGWMKNKQSAMISCNDGFRPVSFLLEVIEKA